MKIRVGQLLCLVGTHDDRPETPRYTSTACLFTMTCKRCGRVRTSRFVFVASVKL